MTTQTCQSLRVFFLTVQFYFWQSSLQTHQIVFLFFSLWSLHEELPSVCLHTQLLFTSLTAPQPTQRHGKKLNSSQEACAAGTAARSFGLRACRRARRYATSTHTYIQAPTQRTTTSAPPYSSFPRRGRFKSLSFPFFLVPPHHCVSLSQPLPRAASIKAPQPIDSLIENHNYQQLACTMTSVKNH